MKKTSTNERGSITVFFCFFAILIVGAMSYSLYIGQQVERRINLQNTADAAVTSMANHGAIGLNMIASNNLAIGASIHISGSVAILSTYLSIARALTYGIKDVGSDFVSIFSSSVSKIQSDVWNRLAIVPSIYMSTAAGITAFNAFIKDYWLYPAPLRSLEATRLNIPGALSLPLQKSRMVPAVTIYGGIKQTDPHDTVCHAILSSKSVNEETRDGFLRWMKGPLITLGEDNELVKGISWIIEKLADLHELVSKVSGVKFGFVNCGYGLKVSLLKSLGQTAKYLTTDNPLASALALKTVNDAFDQASLNRSDFSSCVGSGFFEVCTPSPCAKIYEVGRNLKKTATIAQVPLDGELVERATVAKMLRSVQSNGKLMNCQERDSEGRPKGGNVVGAMPYKDDAGATKCMPTANIKWYCPLRSELSLSLGSCSDKHQERLAANCAGFETFKRGDSGLPIADWGDQAKTYADSSEGGVSSEVRKNSLGFLVPDAEHLTTFKDSITFINAVVNPLRTADQIKPGTPCPTGMKTNVDGKDFCEGMPMMGFTTMFEKASREAMQGRIRQDVNMASGGIDALITQNGADAAHRVGALDGSLTGTFARAQWVVSQAEVAYKAGSRDPQPEAQMQLFWPAWKSHLRPVTLLSQLFDFIAKDSPDRPALNATAQLQGDEP